MPKVFTRFKNTFDWNETIMSTQIKLSSSKINASEEMDGCPNIQFQCSNKKKIQIIY